MLYATNRRQYHALSYSTLVYVLCLHLESVKRKDMVPYCYHHPWNKTCCCNTCQKWADKQILSHIPLAEEQEEERGETMKKAGFLFAHLFRSTCVSFNLTLTHTTCLPSMAARTWQQCDSSSTIPQPTSNGHSPRQASWRQGTGSNCWSVWWSFVILQHIGKNRKQLHSFCNNHDAIWSSRQPCHAPIHASLYKQHTDRRFVLWCTKMSPKTRRDAYIG